MKQFNTPALAEQQFQSVSRYTYSSQPETHSPPVSSRSETIWPVPAARSGLSVPAVLEYCCQVLVNLPMDEQLQVVSQLFGKFISIPPDFLKLVVTGVDHLRASGRTNVLYALAKAIGTMRPNGSDSLMPAKCMPMGLIEYSCNFFTASSVQKV